MKKRIAVIVLLVMLSAMLSCLFVGCGDDEEVVPEKKAIIYVTALLSGGLYDRAEETAVWDPVPMDVNVWDYADEEGNIDIMKVVGDLADNSTDEQFQAILDILFAIIGMEESSTNLLWNLTLDQNGNSTNNPYLTPANDQKGKMDIYYGVLGIYSEVMTALEQRYGEEYEVVMFNYDWRIDGKKNSELLEKFINDNGYTDVVLLSHSLGGQVTNGYLAKSQANRDKVSAYISYAPANLGSFVALTVLNDPVTYIESMLGQSLSSLLENNENPIISGLAPTVYELIDNVVLPFVRNMTSIIQLLPTYEFLTSDQFSQENANGKQGIVIDGVAISSKDALYDYYLTRDWAYLTDEEGNRIPDGNGGYKLKPMVANLRAFHDSLYVDKDGEKVFASSLVNTYYMIGTGVKTDMFYDEVNGKFTSTTNFMGDGMVPTYSSLGAQKLTDIPEGHLYVYDDSQHVPVGAFWDLIGDDCFKIIDSLAE